MVVSINYIPLKFRVNWLPGGSRCAGARADWDVTHAPATTSIGPTGVPPWEGQAYPNANI